MKSRKIRISALLVAAVAIGVTVYVGETRSHNPARPKVAIRSKNMAKPSVGAGTRSIPAELARLERTLSEVRGTSKGQTLLPGYRYLDLGVRAIVDPAREELALTTEEAEHLINIYSEFQEIRARFEQDLVHREPTSAGDLVFKIPAYIEAGKQLRAMMQNEVAVAFGQPRANLIHAKLASDIEQMFLGFGVCEQTFSVREVVDGSQTFLRIQRRATVPPESIPHLSPSIASFGGSGSTANFTLEQLKTGEYSAVAPAIEQFVASGGRLPNG